MVLQASNTSTLDNLSHGVTLLGSDVLTLTIGTLIIVANALTILLICIFPNLRSKTNAILASLAVVDLLTALSLTTLRYALQDRPPGCIISYSFITALADASASHLCIVTLERYVAILHPLHYDMYFNKLCLTLCILACWGLFIAVTAIQFILAFAEDSDSLFRECNTFNYPGTFLYIHIIIIVFVTIVFVVTYIRIFGEIKKQHSGPQNTPGSSQKKSVITVLITVGCFMVCWWPYVICLTVGLVIRENKSVPYLLAQILNYAEILVILNSGMNPMIYVIRMEPFRVAYAKLFQCQVC